MSTIVTLTTLVDELKFYARVQSSEGFTENSDFERVIIDAVRLHNASYTLTSVSSTVPFVEKDVIILFASSRLNNIRASRFAADASTSNQGYGTDRNTPFYKCLELAKLQHQQYEEACRALGLTVYAGSGAAAISEVTCENLDFSAQTPIESSLAPPPIRLTAATTVVQGDGTLVIRWDQVLFGNFASFTVLTMEGSEAIYQDWNYAPVTGILPRTNNNCTVVSTITDPTVKAVKLTGLTATPGTINRFLVVATSKSGKHSYSNEVALTQV